MIALMPKQTTPGVPANKLKEANQHDARIRAKIRKIIYEWNPIGISDLPRDEYDELNRPLEFVLRAKLGQEAIIQLLRWYETEYVGMFDNPDNTRVVAQALITEGVFWEDV